MKRSVLVIIILLSVGLRVVALSWLDYDMVLAPWSWLATDNPAALVTYQPADSSQRLVADAAVGMVTGHGHLAPLEASPHEWNVKGTARAVFRSSSRVVMRGGMDYHHRWGSDACGSVWMEPGQMPFDIVEYTDSTRGNIRQERYGLNGAVGVSVGRGLSLGGRFAYASGSSTKQKDPRHTNSLMELDVRAGVMWQHSGWVVGAAYLLRRFTEAVQFRTYGRTDRTYGYLVDFGATYGRSETTDGKGYTSSDNEKPLLDMRHGLAIEAGYHRGIYSVGGEWRWHHRTGHYGVQSPSFVDFNKHHADRWSLAGWLQRSTADNLFKINFNWTHENLRDYERTYAIVSRGGVSDIEYFDDRLSGKRQSYSYMVGLQAHWGIERSLAAWQVRVQMDYSNDDVTSVVYPYYRLQRVHATSVSADVVRSWLVAGDRVWSLVAGALWSRGGGTPAADSTFGTPADGNTPPALLTETLMRRHEWLVAPRLGASLGVRHSFPVGKHVRIYADARYGYTHAWNIEYCRGNHRHRASLAVGCQF